MILPDDQIAYSKMLIVGRMVHPGSERDTVRWLSETSGAGELLDSGVKLYDKALASRGSLALGESCRHRARVVKAGARDIFP
nr:hypothetical protein [Candidatus Kuenenia stuttgartiensis]